MSSRHSAWGQSGDPDFKILIIILGRLKKSFSPLILTFSHRGEKELFIFPLIRGIERVGVNDTLHFQKTIKTQTNRLPHKQKGMLIY